MESDFNAIYQRCLPYSSDSIVSSLVSPHNTPKARLFAYLKNKSVSTRCELEQNSVCDETKSENEVNYRQSSSVDQVTTPKSGSGLNRKICETVIGSPNYNSGNDTFVTFDCYERKSADSMLEDDFNHLYQEIVSGRQDSVVPTPALLESSHQYPESISRRQDSQLPTPVPQLESCHQGSISCRQDSLPLMPSPLLDSSLPYHGKLTRRQDSLPSTPAPMLYSSHMCQMGVSRRQVFQASAPALQLESCHKGSVSGRQDSLTPAPAPQLHSSHRYQMGLSRRQDSQPPAPAPQLEVCHQGSVSQNQDSSVVPLLEFSHLYPESVSPGVRHCVANQQGLFVNSENSSLEQYTPAAIPSSCNSLRMPQCSSVANEVAETQPVRCEIFKHLSRRNCSESAKKAECEKYEDRLNSWSIVLSRDGTMSLEGYVNGRKHCHRTKVVVKRHGKNVIETLSGSRYRLVGPRQTRSNSMSEHFLEQFNDGFPWNWREILQVAYEELQLKSSCMPMTSNEAAVNISSEQTHAKDKSISQGQSEWSVDTKTGRSCHRILPEPVGEEGLHRSRRSGRILYPPLAFWANQRVIVQRRSVGVSNIHVQGTKNELSDPVRVKFHDVDKKENRKKTRMRSGMPDDIVNAGVKPIKDARQRDSRKAPDKESKHSNHIQSLVKVSGEKSKRHCNEQRLVGVNIENSKCQSNKQILVGVTDEKKKRCGNKPSLVIVNGEKPKRGSHKDSFVNITSKKSKRSSNEQCLIKVNDGQLRGANHGMLNTGRYDLEVNNNPAQTRKNYDFDVKDLASNEFDVDIVSDWDDCEIEPLNSFSDEDSGS